MSAMQSRMVRALPILRPESGRRMAKPNPLLCSLQQTVETGNAGGLGTRKPLVPSYLEMCECRFDRPLSELGTQVLRNNSAR